MHAGRRARGARGRWAAVAFAALTIWFGGAHLGCGDDAKDYFSVVYDAGDEDGSKSDGDTEVDPTLGGPCTEDSQCDDTIPCTFDRCDKTLSRCRNTPDDTVCADPEYCNGKEKCVLRKGCVPGPVVTCQDDNGCSIDRCIEAQKKCEHLQRDSDGDGDPDDHCVGNGDCDDTDPTVSSKQVEICDNLKDDNCDGQIDEQPCSQAANDVCSTALAVTAPGTYLLTTVAAKKDYPTTCSVKTPAAARDIVVEITVPAGGPAKDVLVTATTGTVTNEVAVAVQVTCGQSLSELGCGHIAGSSRARAIARTVPAGGTVYAVVTTQSEGPVDVKVDMPPASAKPSNETCTVPKAVALETPFTVSLVDPAKNLASSCAEAKTGELTYAFTLPSSRDVRIFASTLDGPGEPVVSLRAASCTSELRCRVGTAPALFARSLAPGKHVFSVAGTAQIDASIVVKTYPPTPPPANQSCATAPPIVPNAMTMVDLSAQEDAIKNGCYPGTPTAAYRLDLAQQSDVLVVGRFAQNELGAVAINGAACTTADTIACSKGNSPVRVSARKLAAGSYRVVVADQLGEGAQLTAFVRPYAPPVAVGASDTCVNALTVPASGGFFTGDTTGASADFNASCDAPGMPFGGARDQVLRLDLAQPSRLVLDMTGSFFTTLLDVRQGATCPGNEVKNACSVGAGPERSFVDTSVGAGTYWLQVDGYSGEQGPWNLDVRVISP